MKRICLLTTIFVLAGVAVWAGGYQYVSASDLMQKLERNEEIVLLDIQVEKEFEQHHIAGAVATYAYPVKSDGDREKLDAALTQMKGSDKPVVIVCPRGGGGAKRTYDYLKAKGIADTRLTILEGGQQDWPY
jgi:thiosulfate/3-mercaptopyruvate sulfurtransferase